MRIISDFHDYYDVCQSHGQDQTLMYRRDGRTEEIAVYTFPMVRDRWWSWDKLRPESIVVGFCGKIYPIVRIPDFVSPDYKEHYCLSADEVAQAVAMLLHKKQYAEYMEPLPRRRQWRKPAANTRVRVEEFFEKVAEQQDKHTKLFEKWEAPIFLADAHKVKVTGLRHIPIEINPCLRSVEFYRVIDPYTAYQELAMYLGKQAQPEKPIPDVPDKVMVGAKGFDKWSFRKPPSKRR